jgi:hypothetical protein
MTDGHDTAEARRPAQLEEGAVSQETEAVVADPRDKNPGVSARDRAGIASRRGSGYEGNPRELLSPQRGAFSDNSYRRLSYNYYRNRAYRNYRSGSR